jgi:hypothetical protein
LGRGCSHLDLDIRDHEGITRLFARYGKS